MHCVRGFCISFIFDLYIILPYGDRCARWQKVILVLGKFAREYTCLKYWENYYYCNFTWLDEVKEK